MSKAFSVTKPEVPKLWKHQKQSLALFRKTERGLDLSDPGTAKTRVQLELFAERRKNGGGCALVLAPKSLMRTAWADDAARYTPQLRVSIAYASNRAKAFAEDADIYITNVDASKWLAEQPAKFFDKFDTLIIDELIAYKHRTSQRSRAAAKIVKNFKYRYGLNGTFTDGSVLDTWHQTFLIDDGKTLGTSYFKFRNVVTTPKQVGPMPNMVKWEDNPGAVEAVADLLRPFSVRHEFSKVMDVPDNYQRTIQYHPSAKLLKAYKALEADAILELQEGDISAVNAAVLRNKLLQVASGAAYTSDDGYAVIDRGRYELIAELASEVNHSVVFFNWSHQKEELKAEFDKRGIAYEVIDGKVPVKKREQIVKQYQAGWYKTLLLHPQTGAHGITLTKGTRTIWSSPIYQPGFLKQGTHRIYRGGQTQKTETILVEAMGTVEAKVYAMLNEKNERMVSLLDLLGI